MHSFFIRIQTVVENSHNQQNCVYRKMHRIPSPNPNADSDLEAELCSSGERTPLMSAKSNTVQSDNSSSMNPGNITVVGVPSTFLEPPNAYRSRWRSIKLLYVTTFLSSMSFSINAGSLWPYLTQMDPSANAQLLGVIVAIYSLGQLIASILVGLWANKRGSHKEPIVFTLLVGLLGNVLYSYVEDIPNCRQYALMVARFVLGVYASNIAVIRSYTSGATTMKERTSAFAYLSASQAFGFIFGPAFQAMFSPVGYPGPLASPYLYVNMYTLPCLLMLILIVVNLIAILVHFSEFSVSTDQYMADRRVEQTMKPDYEAVIVCLFMFFTILAVFCLGETLLSPLGMDMYGWTKKDATFYSGLMLLGQGIISVAVFLSVKPVSKHISEKKLLAFGHVLLIIGLVIYIPWGSERPNVWIAGDSPTNSSNLTSTNAPQIEPRGCNALQQAWCLTTPKIHMGQFIGGQIFFAVGYPSSFVIINTLYSKILPPSPQGFMMGLLTSAGCLARLIGPGIVGTLYKQWGPWPTFVTGILLIGLSLALYFISYKMIRPYSCRHRRPLYTQFDSTQPRA